jgi:hypothetical protein
MIRNKIVTVAAVAAAVLGGGAYALASSSSAAPAGPVFHGCEGGVRGRIIYDVFSAGKVPTCPKGAWQVSWNGQGPAGAPGQNATLGPAFTDSTVTSVATGGSFSTNKTVLGTLALPAGTYQVQVNFKATPNAVTGGAVFPSVFIYDGPQASGSFANDLFNVGSGALEQIATGPVPSDVIDSYFSGSGVVTVPAGGETLDVYAFGYDSDTAGGSYAMDNVTVVTTALASS